MINAEDALQLLHSKVLRRFVQIFTASKPPSTMEQKHSALELLLKLTTLLLSPSARSHPAWHRIISNSIEASFYLCRSLLFMLNLNFPPILVTLTCGMSYVDDHKS
jgi:hypothetical protein